MRIIAVATLRDFWEQSQYTDAEEPLKAWYHHTLKAEWQTPHDIKIAHQNASILEGGRVVFNIKGNDYRLVVKIHFNTGIVFIRFVGTHRQYDAIDAETI